MSDLSVTAASCLAGSNANINRAANAGETITAGQAVYKASSGKWMKADSDSATVLARTATGIALNSASLDQPLAVQQGGDITLGATLTANTPYFLSSTAGGICPIADVGTGEYLNQIGIALSTTVLRLSLVATGVAN